MTAVAADGTTGVVTLEALTPNPLNPRGEIGRASVQELADSIRSQGILQPLLVTPDGVVVAGHRRRLAAMQAGLTDVPVIMRDLSEAEQIEIMLVENIQREDLSPVQEARSYRRMVDSGLTKADVARRIGVNHVRVQARLKLLELDDEVMERFHRLELPLAFVEPLLRVKEPHQQRRLATMAARRTMTTKQLETMIERGLGIVNARPPRTATEDKIKATGPQLSRNRREILDALRAVGDQVITVNQVADVFNRTCCACGLESAPGMCDSCPLRDGFLDLAETLARA